MKSKTVIQEREVYPVASNLCPNISRHKNMQQISFRYKQNLLIRIMYDLIRIRLAALAFTAMVVLISTTNETHENKKPCNAVHIKRKWWLFSCSSVCILVVSLLIKSSLCYNFRNSFVLVVFISSEYFMLRTGLFFIYENNLCIDN